MGHLKMMGAVQPFISGAISKTVNMPKDITAEEIGDAYFAAWKLGVKALAIYRDGSKRTQPLNTGGAKEEKKHTETVVEIERDIEVTTAESKPTRRLLPIERHAITHKFTIAGHEGYITAGLYENGQPGELFLVMNKEGSTISGLMDSFATMVSVSLQYGVPLKSLVKKFIHVRFEPAGFTQNAEIPIAKSLVDYIFRWLGHRFLTAEEQMEIGLIAQGSTPPVIETPVSKPLPQSKAVPVAQDVTGQVKIQEHFTVRVQEDAPACADCGSLMVRNGACYKCWNCGSTSGCS
jgi:ribonucleoside-diphosphate reductase alpha chain